MASACNGRNDPNPQCRARTSINRAFITSPSMAAEAPSARDEMQAFYITWRGDESADYADGPRSGFHLCHICVICGSQSTLRYHAANVRGPFADARTCTG